MPIFFGSWQILDQGHFDHVGAAWKIEFVASRDARGPPKPKHALYDATGLECAFDFDEMKKTKRKRYAPK